MKRIISVLLAAAALCMAAGCDAGKDSGTGTGEYTPALTEEPAVTTDDGSLRTLSGRVYSVEGEDGFMDGKIIVKKGTVISLAADTPAFNYLTVNYYAGSPLEAVARYTVDGEETEDVFWLGKGDNMTFSSLTEKYVEGKKAAGLVSLTLTPIKGGTAAFRLYDVTTSVREDYPGENVYITDGKIKVGASLRQGGGLSYYEDLNDGDPGLDNLINVHDEGRLIQQSYYGTSSAPYECGTYSGQTWSYNPVQGGNLNRERSRIIDFSLDPSGKSLYVKCKPRDWAKPGVYSCAYMENTYTIEDGYLKVDNSVTDFMNAKHGSRHQELPAFYTVSYFSAFTFYDGADAWTDGKLTTLPEEPFWAGRSDAYHTFRSDEKWSAWVSPEGYGIGIYTPCASLVLAGRYLYDGSKKCDSDSTNYMAPLDTMKLTAFEKFEYSYYITTGSVESIRSTFRKIAGK